MIFQMPRTECNNFSLLPKTILEIILAITKGLMGIKYIINNNVYDYVQELSWALG